MLKPIAHISIRTLDNEWNFFNVQDFRFDKESNSYLLLSQNNELHTFSRESVRDVIL